MRTSLFILLLPFAVAAYSQADSYREQVNRLNNELRLKQTQIEYNDFRQRLYILIIISVIILALILIYYYRLKQKGAHDFSNTIVNRLEEERTRIARDLHDGLGQSIIVLKNRFNKLRVDDNDGRDQVNAGFSEIIEEIRTISKSLIPPELKRLGLKKAIENKMNELVNTTSLLITTEISDLDKVMLNEEESLRVYRIVQELTTNTMKHAAATAIKVEAIVFSKLLTLVYQDNGTGLDKDKWYTADSSVGLRSILQRVDSMNGSIRIEQPKKGLKVIIKIQLS